VIKKPQSHYKKQGNQYDLIPPPTKTHTCSLQHDPSFSSRMSYSVNAVKPKRWTSNMDDSTGKYG